jgi:hypothetical protein
MVVMPSCWICGKFLDFNDSGKSSAVEIGGVCRLKYFDIPMQAERAVGYAVNGVQTQFAFARLNVE